MRMEKRRKDDNKELLDMLKVKNEQENSEDKIESVGKDIIDKGTHTEIQQVEKVKFDSYLVKKYSQKLSMSH